jgi:hypothetical protein
VAQNTARARRLVAAQARLYSDAKAVHGWRLSFLVVAAVVTCVCALALPDARSYIGAVSGVALLMIAVLVGELEKRRRLQAAAIQEEFDTTVFQLPWNRLLAERPSNIVIARAAARYKGGREGDWYPDTEDTERPLDVLICQSSNLGWGSAMHRLWAAILGAALALLVLGVALVAWVLRLAAVDWLFALVVPVVAVVKEAVELMKANLENARAKESLERKIVELWQAALLGLDVPVEACRGVQDRILHLRQTNSHVPDWLDRVRRAKNESGMRLGARLMVDEARSAGRTGTAASGGGTERSADLRT